MAKDGTNRGGARIGAGRPRKSAAEKQLETGEKKSQTTQTPTIFKPKKIRAPRYLKEPLKNGGENPAVKIFTAAHDWLAKFGLSESIPPQLIENFAQTAGRHIQCEQEISRAGFLVRHPATGEVLANPLVKISLDYLKAAQQVWYQVNQLVRERGVEVAGGDGADAMEKILRLSNYRNERR